MTQNDPSHREWGRVLSLAAIVVLSVIAMPAAAAGAAVAESGGVETGSDSVASPAIAQSSAAELWFRVEADDDTVAAGDEFEVTVEVENVGDEACECEIPLELAVDGETVDSITLETVEAGATEEITLAAETAGLSGETGWSVTADGQEVDGDWVTVEEPPTAAWFEYAVSVPGTVDAGDELSATVEVENTGEESGTTEIAFEVDGEVVDSVAVELEAGATEAVTLTADTADLSGDVDWSVTADDEELESGTVEVQAETGPGGDDGTDDDATDDDDDATDDDDGTTDDDDGIPGFGIAVALAALIGAALLALRD